MAFIEYVSNDQVPVGHRVSDTDNILRIHNIHSKVARLHYNLYRELMHSDGPLTRVQREMIAVAVSVINQCHY